MVPRTGGRWFSRVNERSSPQEFLIAICSECDPHQRLRLHDCSCRGERKDRRRRCSHASWVLLFLLYVNNSARCPPGYTSALLRKNDEGHCVVDHSPSPRTPRIGRPNHSDLQWRQMRGTWAMLPTEGTVLARCPGEARNAVGDQRRILW